MNITRWGITDGMRLAKTAGKELSDPGNFSTQEMIQACEKSLLKFPNEWILYYSLADKYQEVGKYADALYASKKCVEIKNKDIRSNYMLATSYNLLTRANWSLDEISRVNKVLQITDSNVLDNSPAISAVTQLNISIEYCAAKAIYWFSKSRNLNPDAESEININNAMSALFHRFPQLKNK